MDDKVLAFNISKQDSEGVTLLILDNGFNIKKLKLIFKNKAWRLVQYDQSIKPLDQAE